MSKQHWCWRLDVMQNKNDVSLWLAAWCIGKLQRENRCKEHSILADLDASAEALAALPHGVQQNRRRRAHCVQRKDIERLSSNRCDRDGDHGKCDAVQGIFVFGGERAKVSDRRQRLTDFSGERRESACASVVRYSRNLVAAYHRQPKVGQYRRAMTLRVKTIQHTKYKEAGILWVAA
eukprot:3582817-Rhodomonas_salina.1